MGSSAVVAAVKDELQHYPGVDMEIKNGGKHSRAVFFKDGVSRFMTLPISPSDWRAGLNAKRDLRKTMRELGAERIVDYAKRAGRRTRSAVAAIALNAKAVVVVIPTRSPVLSRFKGQDGKPRACWSLELRSNADLSAPPFLALVKTEMPPGLLKRWGITRGTHHSSGGWYFTVARSQVPALSEKVDVLSSVDMELAWANDNEVVFKLPKGVFPTTHEPPANDALQEPQEAPQERVEERMAPSPPMPSESLSTGPQDRPITLQFPKQSVSVEAAVSLLNKRKLQLGTNLRFTVDADGYLSVVHRIGP